MSDKDWKAGDRVQRYKEGNIVTGAITEVVMGERQRHRMWGNGYDTEKFVSGVKVKWDNGEEEELKAYQVSPEDNEMERQFREVVPDAHKRINEKLALAEKYLDEAIAISEETGVAFSTSISYISQSYKPSSFGDRFPDVSEELMKDVTETSNEYEGWEHSAVCY